MIWAPVKPLSDDNVDAVQYLLLISYIVEALLVDEGINGNDRFATKYEVVSTLSKRPSSGD